MSLTFFSQKSQLTDCKTDNKYCKNLRGYFLLILDKFFFLIEYQSR